MIRFVFCFILFICSLLSVYSEINSIKKADSILQTRGELFFSFEKSNNYSLCYLSEIVSIDKVEDNKIWAYANKNDFDRFLSLKILFTIEKLKYPQLSKRHLKSTNLTHYPTYTEYLTILDNYEQNNPNFCTVSEFGKSTQLKSLRSITISNKRITTSKPKVLLNAGIHGDELLGYVLMLRFAKFLLDNKSNSEIEMLLNNIEIVICPLVNPDGAYFGVDNVSNAKRFNANNIDLNRNFSSLEGVLDKNPLQAETQAMMNLMNREHFSLSATFHGGVELVNYPWDEWAATHPDNEWFYRLSRMYADTVHANSFEGYFSYLNNGVTNGYSWYQVVGGRQDWASYNAQSREITIELSNLKMPSEDSLERMCNYHHRALINFLKQSQNGIFIKVLDRKTHKPVYSTFTIHNYDTKYSEMNSDSTTGNIYRLLKSGTYQVEIAAFGFQSKRLELGTRSSSAVFDTVFFDSDTFVSKSITSVKKVYPNPFTNILYFDNNKNVYKSLVIKIFNLSGQECISVKNSREINVSSLKSGVYFVKIELDGHTTIEKLMKL